MQNPCLACQPSITYVYSDPLALGLIKLILVARCAVIMGGTGSSMASRRRVLVAYLVGSLSCLTPRSLPATFGSTCWGRLFTHVSKLGPERASLETFMLGRRDSMLNGNFFLFDHGQRRFLPGARSKIVLDSCLIRKVNQKLIRPVALLILHTRVRL